MEQIPKIPSRFGTPKWVLSLRLPDNVIGGHPDYRQVNAINGVMSPEFTSQQGNLERKFQEKISQYFRLPIAIFNRRVLY